MRKKLNRFFCIIGLLLVCFSGASAQNQSFKHLSSDNGLSHNTQSIIIRDNLDFMWFGTSKGLNKYDGNTITSYFSDARDTTSLHNDFIICLFSDSKNRLWVGTQSGFALFNYEKEQFTNYAVDLTIFNIKEDTQGILWLATSNGIMSFIPETAQLIRISDHFGALQGKATNDLVFLNQNTLLVLYRTEGLYEYNLTSKKATPFGEAHNYIVTANTETNKFSKTSNGVLWLTMRERAPVYIDVLTKNIHELHLPHDAICENVVSYNQYLYMSTLKSGVLVYDTLSKKSSLLKYNPLVAKSLAGNQLRTLYIDSQNILWIGHYINGIDYAPLQESTFQNFLPQKTVTCFASANEHSVWLGTDGDGLLLFDTKLKKVKKQFTVENSALVNNVILSLHVDNESNVWIGTYGEGLMMFSPKTKKWKHFKYSGVHDKIFGYNDIRAILPYSSEKLLLALHGESLASFNIKNSSFYQYQNHENDTVAQLVRHAYALFHDSKSNVWITGANGLSRIDSAGTIYSYDKTLDNENSIPSNYTTGIDEDSHGNVWIGTNNGLCKYDAQDNNFLRIDNDEKKPYVINGLIIDRKDNIWFSAQNSIVQYMPSEKRYTVYSKEDGLHGKDFFINAIHEQENGSLFFGSTNGFIAFQPDSMWKNPTIPPVVITEMYLNNKLLSVSDTSILQKSIATIDTLFLNYDETNISFSFSALNFVANEKNEYAFMLEGFHDNWVYIGNEHRAYFSHIPFGKYEFAVKACNNDGVWNENATRITLIISPPWWQQLWLKVLFFTVLALITFFVIWWRFQRIKRQKQELELAVDRRTAELKDANVSLTQQKEEINDQKKKLEDQANVLQEKLLEVHNQKEDLEALNTELHEQSGELVEKNSQLTNVNNTKNKLISIIAHDVKNPFNMILIAAQQLIKIDDNSNKNAIREYADLIYTSTKNVNSILSNLLNWALNQTGMISFAPSSFNLQSLITSITENNKDFYSKKKIKVSVACSNDIWCYADEQMMRIAIRNLFQNAVKFTPECGLISLFCSIQNDRIVLEIKDTGIGMDKESVEQLFDINAVHSEQGTQQEEGHGLGMLVVKEFLDKNNASIEVHSKRNSGTNFKITIPCGEERKAAANTMVRPTPTKNAENEKNQDITILLVEDNKALREHLTNLLNDHYSVIACEDASKAFEVCKQEFVHIVISDIVMNEVDGITLCKAIKNDLKRSIPVVLITGLENSKMQIEAYNSGADAFIKKPFEFDVLLSRVQNLLTQKNVALKSDFTVPGQNLKPKDEQFIEKLKKEVETGIPNSQFSVELLAQTLGASRASLFRKCKKILGISPSEYIQYARLQVAANLLNDKELLIADIAYMVGFSDPHYFSNCFSKHYGLNPTDFRAKL